MKTKIYIAGKVTGDAIYKSKFYEATKQLTRERNAIVMNPATLPEGMEREDYMHICFAMIDAADEVCFLPDWWYSGGAHIEMEYCKYIGKPISFLKQEEEHITEYSLFINGVKMHEIKVSENEKIQNDFDDAIRHAPVETIPVSQINDLVERAHENAVDHGWYNEKKELPEILSLIHSEVSEVLEEYRNGHKPNETYYPETYGSYSCEPENGICLEPHGIPTELADIIIRIFSYCGEEHINIEQAIYEKMNYNRTREYKHGGKKC